MNIVWQCHQCVQKFKKFCGGKSFFLYSLYSSHINFVLYQKNAFTWNDPFKEKTDVDDTFEGHYRSTNFYYILLDGILVESLRYTKR